MFPLPNIMREWRNDTTARLFFATKSLGSCRTTARKTFSRPAVSCYSAQRDRADPATPHTCLAPQRDDAPRWPAQQFLRLLFPNPTPMCATERQVSTSNRFSANLTARPHWNAPGVLLILLPQRVCEQRSARNPGPAMIARVETFRVSASPPCQHKPRRWPAERDIRSLWAKPKKPGQRASANPFGARNQPRFNS